MGTFAPPQLVVGAIRKDLPFGLFSVLEALTPSEPYWQAGGSRWEFLRTTAEALGAPDETGEPSSGVPKKFEPESGDPVWDDIADAIPFSVYGHFRTSPIAWSQERAENRAIEHLLHREESQVERQLWNGTYDNSPYLDDSPTSLGSGTVRVALALLEEFLADTYGSLGVIHMSRKHASILLCETSLETKGSFLQTKLGTPVVAGSGYGNATIIGSPALFGFRSEVFTSSQAGSPLLDTRNNDLYAIAERTYLIGYDPTGVGSVTIS